MANFVILPAPAVVPDCPSPTEKKYNEELLELKSHLLKQGIFFSILLLIRRSICIQQK